jgi:hypothetical protein
MGDGNPSWAIICSPQYGRRSHSGFWAAWNNLLQPRISFEMNNKNHISMTEFLLPLFITQELGKSDHSALMPFRLLCVFRHEPFGPGYRRMQNLRGVELSQLIGNMRILQKYFFIGGRVRLEIRNVSIGGREWGG